MEWRSTNFEIIKSQRPILFASIEKTGKQQQAKAGPAEQEAVRVTRAEAQEQ
jgi:hypothetical protein